MEHLALPAPKVKRRRKHSKEFKRQAVVASHQPGKSIASVARDYQINANLLHKWRKELVLDGSEEFVRIPVVGNAHSDGTGNGEEIRIDLPGGIVVHWPVRRVSGSVDWLKAIMMP